jgi:hypothetical protein
MACPACLVAVAGTEGIGDTGAVCSAGQKFTVLSIGFVAGVLAALWFDESRMRGAAKEAGYAYARGWSSGARTRKVRRYY